MVEKLKSVLAPVPWSLVVKGFVFGLAWFYLPYFVFAAIAIYLFIFPPFQIFRLLPLFVLILWFGFFSPPAFRESVLISVLFFILLGMKGFIFVDRSLVSELFLIITSFLLWQVFFISDSWPGLLFLFQIFIILGIHFFLLTFRDLFVSPGPLPSGKIVLYLLFCFLAFQFSWMMNLLPLESDIRALILCLLLALFLETLSFYISKNLDIRNIFWLIFLIAGAILVIIAAIPFSLGT